MCKTIKQKVKFKAAPAEIYKILTDSKWHVGGKFSAENGRVSGIVVDLKPGRRIVQAWRRRDFPEGIFSMAAVELTPSGRGTQLVLTHRGVPKELIPSVERDWRKSYWAKIKKSLLAE